MRNLLPWNPFSEALLPVKQPLSYKFRDFLLIRFKKLSDPDNSNILQTAHRRPLPKELPLPVQQLSVQGNTALQRKVRKRLVHIILNVRSSIKVLICWISSSCICPLRLPLHSLRHISVRCIFPLRIPQRKS